MPGGLDDRHKRDRPLNREQVGKLARLSSAASGAQSALHRLQLRAQRSELGGWRGVKLDCRAQALRALRGGAHGALRGGAVGSLWAADHEPQARLQGAAQVGLAARVHKQAAGAVGMGRARWGWVGRGGDGTGAVGMGRARWGWVGASGVARADAGTD